MKKKIQTFEKYGVVKCVLNYMKDRNLQPKQCDYLKSIQDVDNAYIIANRYIRKYFRFADDTEKNSFYKKAKLFGMIWNINGGKWLSNDESLSQMIESNMMIDDNGKSSLIGVDKISNDELISKISKSDNAVRNVETEVGTTITIVETKTEKSSTDILNKAIEFGVTYFNVNFLKNNGIKFEKVGTKDEKCVCYCNSINSFIFVR